MYDIQLSLYIVELDRYLHRGSGGDLLIGFLCRDRHFDIDGRLAHEPVQTCEIRHRKAAGRFGCIQRNRADLTRKHSCTGQFLERASRILIKCNICLCRDLIRSVHARIDALAEKLAEMEKRRGESRKARAKTGMPVVSLVGYTNVGKSSLMNALCGPSVAEADMLFATLDPTSRKLVLPSGMAVLLVDTVGFVSRLPHNLVEAFKSTLEEAAWSDVIVRVADAGDDQREEQLAITDEVLDGLDCADIPRLTVYNKCDKPNALNFDPDILLTSAKTGYGLDALLKKLDELLSDRVHTIRVLLPYDKLGLAAPMRERGSVQVEEYREDGLYLEGIVKTEDLHCFEGYLV